MSYLLDTNILSATVRPNPNPVVLRWLSQVPDHHLYISVLTLGEIRKGEERVTSGARRERLRLWLENDLPGWFKGRILPVDQAVADRWGRLTSDAERSLPAIDTLLAATALAS